MLQPGGPATRDTIVLLLGRKKSLPDTSHVSPSERDATTGAPSKANAAKAWVIRTVNFIMAALKDTHDRCLWRRMKPQQ
jgi:hypothetical protein